MVSIQRNINLVSEPFFMNRFNNPSFHSNITSNVDKETWEKFVTIGLRRSYINMSNSFSANNIFNNEIYSTT